MIESSSTESSLESPAARIIDELLEAGEAVDDGVFTLDAAAAAAKLEAFAYADRSSYLIPIVEGLIGLGARMIRLETEREDLRIRGLGLNLQDIERWFTDLYSCAIGSNDDALARAFGRLAIGLDMILGGGTTERVRLSYSTVSEAVIAEYRFRAAPQISRAQPGVIRELAIEIDHAWFRIAGRQDALDHLRAAVRFSDREVRLDGELISGQARDWFETLRGEGPGYRFTAGLEQSGEQPSAIELWTAGVCVETVPEKGVAFRAAIELDAPRRDLSQSKVVRDVTVEQAIAAVIEAHDEARRRLDQADQSWTHETRPRAWPPARVDLVLVRAPRPPSVPLVKKQQARAPLGGVQLWTSGAVEPSFAFILGFITSVFAISCSFIGVWLLTMPEISAAPLFYFAVGTGAVSVPLVLPTLRNWRRLIRAREQGIRAHAIVVGHQQRPHRPPHPQMGQVCWKYTDHTGTEHTGRSCVRGYAEARSWQIGEQIVIYYEAERPDASWWEADIGPRS